MSESEQGPRPKRLRRRFDMRLSATPEQLARAILLGGVKPRPETKPKPTPKE